MKQPRCPRHVLRTFCLLVNILPAVLSRPAQYSRATAAENYP
jgi:hypothetical protein